MADSNEFELMSKAIDDFLSKHLHVLVMRGLDRDEMHKKFYEQVCGAWANGVELDDILNQINSYEWET